MTWPIKTLDLEPSTQCNAGCPMCARSFQGVANTQLPLANLTVDALEPLRPYLDSMTLLTMCGNYGDPILNPELFSLIDFARSVNPNCDVILHTNGGARNIEWWQKLAQYPKLKVRFGIDGLVDTNHIYRRNVRWDRLEENYRAFIAAGGIAEWKFIVFKHNEHQVESARQLAIAEGFENFLYVVTNRFTQGDRRVFTMHPDAEDKTPLYATDLEFNYHELDTSHPGGRTLGIYSKPGKPKTGKEIDPQPTIIPVNPNSYNSNVQPADNNIQCYAKQEGIVYVSAVGDLYPCCHLGYVYGGSPRYDNLSWLPSKSINLYHTPPAQIFKWFDEVQTRWTQNNCLTTCQKVCGKSTGIPNLFKTEELKA